MMDEARMKELSASLVQGLEQADRELLDNILSPDFSMSYNFMEMTLSKAQALESWPKHFSVVKTKFRNVEVIPTSKGWLQQYRLDSDGESSGNPTIVDYPVCMVVTVTDDKISHMYEYIDTAGIKAAATRP